MTADTHPTGSTTDGTGHSTRKRRVRRRSQRPARSRRERAVTLAFYAFGLAFTALVTYLTLVMRGEP